MNRTLVAAVAAAALLGVAGLAQAHGRVQWSVTVGSPGYVTPPGVVVSPQPGYIYGAPPGAFTPPPAVVYVQPPYPAYAPPPVLYVEPWGRPIQRSHDYRRHRNDSWNGGWHGGWHEGNRDRRGDGRRDFRGDDRRYGR